MFMVVHGELVILILNSKTLKNQRVSYQYKRLNNYYDIGNLSSKNNTFANPATLWREMEVRPQKTFYKMKTKEALTTSSCNNFGI